MIELVSCVFDAVVCAICFAAALVRLTQTRNRAWMTLVFAVGCSLIASTYWVGYLVVFGETPVYFYVSEIGWAATYLFFIMLLMECDSTRKPSAPILAAWIPVVVSAALFFLFIYLKGNPLLNLLDNGFMAMLGYYAVKGLMAPSGPGLSGNRAFAGALLVYVAAELAMWTASCLCDTQVFGPYIVLSYVLPIVLVGIVACAWRSERI